MLSFRKVRFLPGSFDKRFANNMAALAESGKPINLSQGQEEWVFRILYKYRKQIPQIYERYKTHHLCQRK